MHFFHLIKFEDVQQTFIRHITLIQMLNKSYILPKKRSPAQIEGILLFLLLPPSSQRLSDLLNGVPHKDVCIIRFYSVIISAFIVIIPGLQPLRMRDFSIGLHQMGITRIFQILLFVDPQIKLKTLFCTAWILVPHLIDFFCFSSQVVFSFAFFPLFCRNFSSIISASRMTEAATV